MTGIEFNNDIKLKNKTIMKTQKILLLTFAIAMFATTHAQIQFLDHTIIDNTNAAITNLFFIIHHSLFFFINVVLLSM